MSIDWRREIKRGSLFLVLFLATFAVAYITIERFALICERDATGFVCALERKRYFNTEQRGFDQRTLLGAEVRRSVTTNDPRDNTGPTVVDTLSLLTDAGRLDTNQDSDPQERADSINRFVRDGDGARLEIVESNAQTRYVVLAALTFIYALSIYRK